MNLTELIEQLELIKHDHPEAADFDVRAAGSDVFAIHLGHEEEKEYAADFVEIELYRPFALTDDKI
jgi:hypothetical protein